MTLKDKKIFAQNLSDLLKSFVPLPSALQLLAYQKKLKSFEKQIKDVKRDVVQGHALSLSIKKYLKGFTSFETSLIELGENTGDLSSVVERLANDLERQWILRQKTLKSLSYPIMVLFVGMLVIGFMMIIVLPKILSALGDIETESLSWITKMILSMHHAMQNNNVGGMFLIVLILVGGLVWGLLRQKSFQEKGQKVLDHLPWIGSLRELKMKERICRSLGVLMEAGQTFDQSLFVTSMSLEQSLTKTKISKMHKQAQQGESCSSLWNKHFPKDMDIVERISVGEQIGMLGIIFSKLSDQLAEQIQDQMDVFSSLIGPSVLIVVMVGVGTVLLGIVLPLMQIDSLINF